MMKMMIVAKIPTRVVNLPTCFDFTQPETDIPKSNEKIPIAKLIAEITLTNVNLDSLNSNGYPLVVIIFIPIFPKTEMINDKTANTDA